MNIMRVGALSLAVLASPGWSQGDATQTLDSGEAERARIERVRQQRNAELDAEDAACLSKFAVTDCQNKVSVRRRLMLADLKRQEAVINAAQRRQKGLDQVRSAEEKAAESRQRQLEAQANAEKTPLDDRKRAQEEKVLNHQQQASSAGHKTPGGKSTSVLDAKAIEKNREAYLKKQKDLEKRRQDRDQRLLDHGAGGPPLPVAP